MRNLRRWPWTVMIIPVAVHLAGCGGSSSGNNSSSGGVSATGSMPVAHSGSLDPSIQSLQYEYRTYRRAELNSQWDSLKSELIGWEVVYADPIPSAPVAATNPAAQFPRQIELFLRQDDDKSSHLSHPSRLQGLSPQPVLSQEVTGETYRMWQQGLVTFRRLKPKP